MIRTLPRESPLRETACEVLVNRYRLLVRSCSVLVKGSPDFTEVADAGERKPMVPLGTPRIGGPR
jgi:hypothetical protein